METGQPGDGGDTLHDRHRAPSRRAAGAATVGLRSLQHALLAPGEWPFVLCSMLSWL